jgi:thioredoxin 1
MSVEMINEPIHVSDLTFEKTVLQSSLPVIVDFWAPWCGPCQRVGPILESLAKEFAGKLLITKVNVDESAEWAGKYGVQNIPTMLFFSKGKIAFRQVGALPKENIREIIDQFLEVSKQ